jgi:hypothetical protein
VTKSQASGRFSQIRRECGQGSFDGLRISIKFFPQIKTKQKKGHLWTGFGKTESRGRKRKNVWEKGTYFKI